MTNWLSATLQKPCAYIVQANSFVNLETKQLFKDNRLHVLNIESIDSTLFILLQGSAHSLHNLLLLCFESSKKREMLDSFDLQSTTNYTINSKSTDFFFKF